MATADPSRIAALVGNRVPDSLPIDRRFVIALAGPPTAGKTTTAEALRHGLSPSAAVLGLDAFHYDDAILNERGHRPRKGAPHTFDVDGYRRLLVALRNEPTATIAVPRFDRDLELSRTAAELVGPQHQIIITEGNYLLLDQDPWAGLAPLFDLTVFLDVSIEVVESRTMQRWHDHGFTVDEAKTRYSQNDAPNARLILENSRPADMNT